MQISVVIPLYNKLSTIERAITSVQNQTFQPTEILVVNDGSTDGSAAYVEQLNLPLVRLVNQQNGGVSSARNTGIKEATTEWVAFLDADDEWLPNFLETIVELHRLYPEASVLATAYYNCFHATERKSINLKKIQQESYQILDYFKVASFSSPPVWSSAVVARKNEIVKTGGFPVGIVAGEDLLTWARLAKSVMFAYCTKPLANYFIENELVFRKERLQSIVINNKTVSHNFNQLLDLSEKYERFYLAEWYKIISLQYLRLAIKKEAFNSIIKSIYLRPFRIKIYIYLLLLVFPAIMRRKILK